MPRSVRVASVVPECAWSARRRFWIMSHQAQLSPAGSHCPTAALDPAGTPLSHRPAAADARHSPAAHAPDSLPPWKSDLHGHHRSHPSVPMGRRGHGRGPGHRPRGPQRWLRDDGPAEQARPSLPPAAPRPAAVSVPASQTPLDSITRTTQPSQTMISRSTANAGGEWPIPRSS
jgi:hypothetical protein